MAGPVRSGTRLLDRLSPHLPLPRWSMTSRIIGSSMLSPDHRHRIPAAATYNMTAALMFSAKRCYPTFAIRIIIDKTGCLTTNPRQPKDAKWSYLWPQQQHVSSVEYMMWSHLLLITGGLSNNLYHLLSIWSDPGSYLWLVTPAATCIICRVYEVIQALTYDLCFLYHGWPQNGETCLNTPYKVRSR